MDNPIINVDELAVAAAIAVQAVMVMFFVISPLMGSVMWAGARKRKNSVLVLSLSLLIFNLTFVGLTFLLQRAINDSSLDHAITFSSLAVAALLMFLSGRYLYWVMSPSNPKDLMEAELRYYLQRDPATLTPWEKNRVETLKRYYRRKS
jgi:hypothetical protein